jgi:hypothetical protein
LVAGSKILLLLLQKWFSWEGAAVQRGLKPASRGTVIVRSCYQAYTSEHTAGRKILSVCEIGMICSAKPVLTEDLRVMQKQEFFNNMLYVRNVQLTKGQAYS